MWRYRETPRVGMLTLTELALPGETYAGRANELAGGLMLDFQAAGIYEPEKRDWKPHITVARFRAAPRLTPAIPTLEPFSAARRRPLRIKAQPQRLDLCGAPLNAVHGVARPRAAANTSPRSTGSPLPGVKRGQESLLSRRDGCRASRRPATYLLASANVG